MSNYIPLVKKTYDFEGDTVIVTFKRLTRAQMISLTPFLPETEETEMTNEQNVNLMENVSECVSENMVECSGLRDAEGNALDLKEHIDDMYFMELVTLISTDLMESSMVNAKKLKRRKEESTESTKVTKDIGEQS